MSMNTFMNTHTHTHTHTYIYIYIHTHTYMHTYIGMHMYVSLYVCIRIQTYWNSNRGKRSCFSSKSNSLSVKTTGFGEIYIFRTALPQLKLRVYMCDSLLPVCVCVYVWMHKGMSTTLMGNSQSSLFLKINHVASILFVLYQRDHQQAQLELASLHM